MKYIYTILTILIVTEYFLEKTFSTTLPVTNVTQTNSTVLNDISSSKWNNFIHFPFQTMYSSFIIPESEIIQDETRTYTNGADNDDDDTDDDDDDGNNSKSLHIFISHQKSYTNIFTSICHVLYLYAFIMIIRSSDS